MPLSEERATELKLAYRVLDVPLDASAHVIKAKYQKMLRKWYPGDQPGDGREPEMKALIDDAYSKIRNAPLRYYVETHPLFRQTGSSSHVASRLRVVESDGDSFEEMDQLEFWIRFVCGGLLGALFSLELILRGLIYQYSHGSMHNTVSWGVVIMIIGLFGAAAARYGDRFWHGLFRYWWLWR
jgi:hypothetical protein